MSDFGPGIFPGWKDVHILTWGSDQELSRPATPRDRSREILWGLVSQSFERSKSAPLEWGSMAEVLVEELSDFCEFRFVLGHAIIHLVLSVRHSVENFELCIDAGLLKLLVHTDRVAEQQVACSRGQDRRRKAMHISVDG